MFDDFDDLQCEDFYDDSFDRDDGGDDSMAQRIVQLESLLREAVSEEPKTECADNGTKCAFCFREYRSGWPTKGFHVVHTDDCWLVRAKKAIGD